MLSEGKCISYLLIIKRLRLTADSLSSPLSSKCYDGSKVVDLMRTTHLSTLEVIGLSEDSKFRSAEEMSVWERALVPVDRITSLASPSTVWYLFEMRPW